MKTGQTVNTSIPAGQNTAGSSGDRPAPDRVVTPIAGATKTNTSPTLSD